MTIQLTEPDFVIRPAVHRGEQIPTEAGMVTVTGCLDGVILGRGQSGRIYALHGVVYEETP